MRDIYPALRHLWRTDNGGLHIEFGDLVVGNLCVIPLAVADLDHEGTIAKLQVWDHSGPQDGNRWRYGIWQSYHVGSQWPDMFERGWQVRWDEWEIVPNYSEFGAIVDTWLTAPEALRFILV